MRFPRLLNFGLVILWLAGCQNTSLPPSSPAAISTPLPQSSEEVPALGDKTLLNQAPVAVDQAGRQDPKSLHYRPCPAEDGWSEDNPESAGPDSPAQSSDTPPPDTGSPDHESLLKAAREAKEKAFTHYTRLVTVGDEPGDVEQALQEYREAVQKLEQLQQSR